MAEIEDVVVLNVKADDAVRTVQDLRDNIKAYKEFINRATIGSDEYKDAVEGLTQTQLALKNAMNASTASLKEVIQDAKGAGTSYNALVSQMAQLKQAFRATSDEMERARLGREIKDINDQLKAMDAMQGNFQRNVGNYTQGVSDALKDLAKDMPSFFGAAKNGVKDVSDSLALLGKQPIMGLVLMLAPILTKIVEKLKENGTALEAIKKVGDALEPVFDVLTKTVEWLAQQLSKAADWFVELLGNSNGTFKAIISGAVGAGNAILQALLTPIRAAIEGVKGFGAAIGKVFKGDFKGARADAAEAAKGIGDAFRKGFSFESNFEKGKEVAAKFIDGLGTGSKKAKEKGKEAGKAYKEGVEEELAEDNALDYLNASDKADAQRKKDNDKLFADLNEKARIREEANAKIVAAEQAVTDALAKEEEQRAKDAQDAAEKTKKAWEAGVTGTANLLSTLADVYEANAEGDEKATEKIKALRIASATIEMLQGAVTAYSTAQQLGPVAGPIVGAINAAAVTAAGLANIAKIRATSTSGSGGAVASPTKPSSNPGGAAASIAAQPVASPTAMATMATDTQTLNAIGSQRVYILASDLEANDSARKVRVQETTF